MNRMNRLLFDPVLLPNHTINTLFTIYTQTFINKSGFFCPLLYNECQCPNDGSFFI